MSKLTFGEKVYQVFNYAFLTLLAFMTLYPFLYVIFASFSNPVKLYTHEGLLLYPQGFTTRAYEMVLKDPRIVTGYANTIFYVVVGTALNIIMSCIGAYVLSRPYLKLRRFFTIMIVFTMYFGGGLIPHYLLVKSLHLDNTRWALIVPGLINTWNLIIMMTAFRNVPISLDESARIDGAGEWRILFQIVLPLVVPTIMVMVLYYAVGHWNSWFNAMIYLRDRGKYPLQLFLREILVENRLNEIIAGQGQANEVEDVGTTIKYATIIVSTVPILLVYPFIQKYFVHGVMIGAIKG